MKKLTNVHGMLLAITLILIVNSAYSQFTRTQANNLVLNTIVDEDLDKVDVYSSYSSQPLDATLIDNVEIDNPYADSWVFFINDNPFASWYHPCRLVYVSTLDGTYTVNNVEIYPKGLSENYEEISLADRPEPIAMESTAYVPNPEKVLSNYNHALIIVSMDEARSWYNTSLIYNVLMQSYNYQKENITILYSYDGETHIPYFNNDLDGDTYDNDIDGPATYSNIQTTISELSSSLEHSDQLAVNA